jgi:hypothetical protein
MISDKWAGEIVRIYRTMIVYTCTYLLCVLEGLPTLQQSRKCMTFEILKAVTWNLSYETPCGQYGRFSGTCSLNDQPSCKCPICRRVRTADANSDCSTTCHVRTSVRLSAWKRTDSLEFLIFGVLLKIANKTFRFWLR